MWCEANPDNTKCLNMTHCKKLLSEDLELKEFNDAFEYCCKNKIIKEVIDLAMLSGCYVFQEKLRTPGPMSQYKSYIFSSFNYFMKLIVTTYKEDKNPKEVKSYPRIINDINIDNLFED